MSKIIHVFSKSFILTFPFSVLSSDQLYSFNFLHFHNLWSLSLTLNVINSFSTLRLMFSIEPSGLERRFQFCSRSTVSDRSVCLINSTHRSRECLPRRYIFLSKSNRAGWKNFHESSTPSYPSDPLQIVVIYLAFNPQWYAHATRDNSTSSKTRRIECLSTCITIHAQSFFSVGFVKQRRSPYS